MSCAHNEFKAGVTYDDIFSVSSADGTLTSVAIHILGTNDAAVLSSDTRNLTETDAAQSTSGDLTIADVDSDAIFVTQSGTAGTYGTFNIDATGHWTYDMKSGSNAFRAGVTYDDIFNVSSADGTATSVAIHILGTNDAAVLSSNTRNLTESDASQSTSGDLTISDVDSDTVFVSQSGTAGAYGTFNIDATGHWTYDM